MFDVNIQTLQDDLDRTGICLFYDGVLTEDIHTSLSEVLKQRLELNNLEKTVSRNLFSFFVELTQNIIRYSAHGRTEENDGVVWDIRYGRIVVGQSGEHWFVYSSNPVQKVPAEKLERNLKELKSLNQAQLKSRYRQILRGEAPEGSKGAGVGFVEIARKSENQFDFDFSDLESGLVQFSFMAIIS